ARRYQSDIKNMIFVRVLKNGKSHVGAIRRASDNAADFQFYINHFFEHAFKILETGSGAVQKLIELLFRLDQMLTFAVIAPLSSFDYERIADLMSGLNQCFFAFDCGKAHVRESMLLEELFLTDAILSRFQNGSTGHERVTLLKIEQSSAFD